tara:strand:- start:455 stop:760 length:306 start_codon:yes stop_codon:yes gene_type:complete
MYSRSADFEKHIKSKQHLFIVHQMVNVAKMKQTMLDLLVYTEQDFDVVGDLKEDGTFNSKIMTTKTGIDISQYKDPFSKFYNANSVPTYEESEEMEATKVI